VVGGCVPVFHRARGGGAGRPADRLLRRDGTARLPARRGTSPRQRAWAETDVRARGRALRDHAGGAEPGERHADVPGRQLTRAAHEASPGRGALEGRVAAFSARAISTANALKIPRSHDRTSVVRSSGCHCTASTHHAGSSTSTPSITPSAATAVTRSPAPPWHTA